MKGSLQDFMNIASLEALEEAAKELEKVTFSLDGDAAGKIVRELMGKYMEKEDDQTRIPT